MHGASQAEQGAGAHKRSAVDALKSGWAGCSHDGAAKESAQATFVRDTAPRLSRPPASDHDPQRLAAARRQRDQEACDALALQQRRRAGLQGQRHQR